MARGNKMLLLNILLLYKLNITSSIHSIHKDGMYQIPTSILNLTLCSSIHNNIFNYKTYFYKTWHASFDKPNVFHTMISGIISNAPIVLHLCPFSIFMSLQAQKVSKGLFLSASQLNILYSLQLCFAIGTQSRDSPFKILIFICKRKKYTYHQQGAYLQPPHHLQNHHN